MAAASWMTIVRPMKPGRVSGAGPRSRARSRMAPLIMAVSPKRTRWGQKTPPLLGSTRPPRMPKMNTGRSRSRASALGMSHRPRTFVRATATTPSRTSGIENTGITSPSGRKPVRKLDNVSMKANAAAVATAFRSRSSPVPARMLGDSGAVFGPGARVAAITESAPRPLVNEPEHQRIRDRGPAGRVATPLMDEREARAHARSGAVIHACLQVPSCDFEVGARGLMALAEGASHAGAPPRGPVLVVLEPDAVEYQTPAVAIRLVDRVAKRADQLMSTEVAVELRSGQPGSHRLRAAERSAPAGSEGDLGGRPRAQPAFVDHAATAGPARQVIRPRSFVHVAEGQRLRGTRPPRQTQLADDRVTLRERIVAV